MEKDDHMQERTSSLGWQEYSVHKDVKIVKATEVD